MTILEIPKLTYTLSSNKKKHVKKKKKKAHNFYELVASQQTSGFERFLLVSVLLVEILLRKETSQYLIISIVLILITVNTLVLTLITKRCFNCTAIIMLYNYLNTQSENLTFYGQQIACIQYFF